MIDVQEVEDLEVAIPFRDAKPSEILRSQPRDKWCVRVTADGLGRHCAVGWLATVGGWQYKPGDPKNPSSWEFVAIHYGVPPGVLDRVMRSNDEYGQTQAIRVLEEAGY